MADNKWTDELKEQVVELYLEKNPTTENTMEAVKEVANEVGQTPNGVRMVLTRAGVYVKKTPTASGKSTASSGDGAKRVNKAEAIDALKVVIRDAGQEVDDDICDRLTGKAAVYLAKVIQAVQ